MKTLHKTELSECIIGKLSTAKKRIWIASPYIGSYNSVFGILGENFQFNKNLDLKMLVDVSDILNCDYLTLNSLMELDFKIKTLSGLHAKIYIIDNESIVTSANLTGRAFERKLEIGVLLEDIESKDVVSIFEKYFTNGKKIGRFGESQVRKQKDRRKRGGDGREYGHDSCKFYSIPKPKVQKFILEKSNMITELKNFREDNKIWKISLGHRWSEEEVYKSCIKHNRIAIGWFDEDISSWKYEKILIELKRQYYGVERKQNANSIYNFVNTMLVGDIVLVYSGSQNIRAIGIVSGKYYYDKNADNYRQFRDVVWLTYENSINIYKLNKDTNLTEITLYELFRIEHSKFMNLTLSL